MEGTETLSVTGGIGVAAGVAGVSSLSGISLTVRYNGMVSAFGWRITLLGVTYLYSHKPLVSQCHLDELYP